MKLNWADHEGHSEAVVDNYHLLIVKHYSGASERWHGIYIDRVVMLCSERLVEPSGATKYFFADLDEAKEKALEYLIDIFETRAGYYSMRLKQYRDGEVF